MIFQILATMVLATALATVILRSFSFTTLKLVLIGVLSLGLIFVWRPDDLTLLANFLGIDRGADLVNYLSTMVLLLFVVSVAINSRRVDRQITLLSRQVALGNAQAPSLEAASHGDESASVKD